VNENGVYTDTGDPIHYLYRLYPLEYFSADKGPNGEAIGDLFLNHVAFEKIKLINPPGSFLCQNKMTMAIVWALHEENHPLFSEEEHAIIAEYFLPTYVNPEPLFGSAYVRKPVFGREGGGVAIIGADGNVISDDKTPYYYNQPAVYQKYTEMPKVTVETWDGPYTGSMLVGSFLINGKASGLFLRVGGKITGNTSMFLPYTVV
jgi:glutathionylspermidine synthase